MDSVTYTKIFVIVVLKYLSSPLTFVHFQRAMCFSVQGAIWKFYFCVVYPSAPPLQQINSRAIVCEQPLFYWRVDYANSTSLVPGSSLQVIFRSKHLTRVTHPRSYSEVRALRSPSLFTGASLDAPLLTDYSLHCLWPDFVSCSQQVWVYLLHP